MINGLQLFMVLFAAVIAAISIYAVVVVVPSPYFSKKPLWIIGSLFGFMGFSIDWTVPDDLAITFGIQIPVVVIFKILPAGPVIVKALFPFVAVGVIYRKHSHDSSASKEETDGLTDTFS